jgi:hypothetical protein
MIRWPRFQPDDQQVMRLGRRIETGTSYTSPSNH